MIFALGSIILGSMAFACYRFIKYCIIYAEGCDAKVKRLTK